MTHGLSVSVGTSAHPDSFEAGEEAARQALRAHEAQPDALIVFGACCFDFRQLMAGITSVTGHRPMVGGTQFSLIARIHAAASMPPPAPRG